MDGGSTDTWKQLLGKHLPEMKTFTAYVKGESMFPILHEGEIIEVNICKNEDEIKIGDILIYPYKKEGFIIHRLLKIQNDRYFCKGDNSLRLEDISFQDILGVVKVENDFHRNQEFIESSLLISKLYRRCRYNAELTRSQREYKEYISKYLVEMSPIGGLTNEEQN